MGRIRLALLFAFVYAVNGQTAYFDIGTSIRVTPSEVPGDLVSEAVPPGTAGSRKICHDGTNLLYTDDNRVMRQDGSEAMTTPNGESIWGLGCCCNVIAITYSTATQLRIRFSVADSDIDVDVLLRDLAEENVAEYAVLHCKASESEIVVLSGRTMWIFNTVTLTYSPTSYGLPDSTALAGRQTCLSYRKTGSVYHVYVTVFSGDYIVAVSLDRSDSTIAVTRYEMVDDNGFPLDVYCVDYDNEEVYALVEDFNSQYSIRNILYDDVINASGEDTTGSGDVFFDGDTGISSQFATGLVICGEDCGAEDCSAGDACECTPEVCGFCVFGSNLCQCGNSLNQDPCFYLDNAGICEKCMDQPDAQLLIYNPLAKRREGEVDVYGVLVGAGDIIVSRAVKVGRFGPEVWGKPYGAEDASVDDDFLTIIGFNAPAPDRLRGSRFGVYWSDIVPEGEFLSVVIPGVVTENSGFTNAQYTITANLNDDVTLDASMTDGLLRYAGTLRWLFTPVDLGAKTTGTPRPPSCTFVREDKLSCTLESVQRPDEGVYEVYRPRRQPRNWHPIFYLFVRQCEAGAFGELCSPCPECMYGQCDDVCGDCICYPGWTGSNCDTPCESPSRIGDTCTIECGDIFEDSTDCKGVMVCKPGRLGCACRSGLQPPECLVACEEGFYGPNCKEVCGDCEACDPVFGCPQ